MPQALALTVQEVVCQYDVDSFGREVGSDLEALVQDVLHTLIEETGSNIDLPDRGVGINSLLSGKAANVRTVASRIDQQLPLDDRIDASTTTIAVDSSGTYNLNIEIQVDGEVVGISLAYAAAAGLTLVDWNVL